MDSMLDDALDVMDGEVVEDKGPDKKEPTPSKKGRTAKEARETKSDKAIWDAFGKRENQVVPSSGFSFMSKAQFDKYLLQCKHRRHARGQFMLWLFEEVFKEGLHYGKFQNKKFTSKPILFLAGAELITQVAGAKVVTEPDYSDHWKDFWAKGYFVFVTTIEMDDGLVSMWGIGHPEEDGNANRGEQLAAKRSFVSAIKRAFSLSEFFVMEPEEITTNVWAQLSLAPTAPRDPRFTDGGQDYQQGPHYHKEPAVAPQGPAQGPPPPMPTRARPDMFKHDWHPKDGLSSTISAVTQEIAKRRGIPWDREYMVALVSEASRFRAKRGPRKGQIISAPGDPNEINNDAWREKIVGVLRKLAAKLRRAGEAAMEGFEESPSTTEEIVDERTGRQGEPELHREDATDPRAYEEEGPPDEPEYVD